MFNIALVEPDIPQNTGNIGRLCVGFNSVLHLVEPFGFELSDRTLKRAGLDYWEKLEWYRYKNFKEFDASSKPIKSRRFYLTTKAEKSFYDIKIAPGDTFVFGKETRGLDEETILKPNWENAVTIQFPGEVRSFNLANTVAMVLAEAQRQNPTTT